MLQSDTMEINASSKLTPEKYVVNKNTGSASVTDDSKLLRIQNNQFPHKQDQWNTTCKCENEHLDYRQCRVFHLDESEERSRTEAVLFKPWVVSILRVSCSSALSGGIRVLRWLRGRRSCWRTLFGALACYVFLLLLTNSRSSEKTLLPLKDWVKKVSICYLATYVHRL